MRYFPSKIEKKWQARWLKEKTYEPELKRAKRPFYNLMMFPYPSAEGLHVGNMYAFTGSDIYGRLKRMQGHDVFEPIGLDGFGIHSENYAIKVGKHPAAQAKVSEKIFYRQLAMLGNGFAWRERLETYDPEYYKWTQWIFLQLYKNGLAYRKKSPVNWCPSCKTVLADEQVIGGRCERCGTEVIKKNLEQWFFKITDYVERLHRNLETIDWSEKVKIAQKNWIGRSEGALLKFSILNSQFSIEVFTTRPDTLFGATFMVLGPEHPLLANSELRITNRKEVDAYIVATKKKTDEERIAEGKEKTGVELKGVKAINPANKKEISIFVADYVLGHVGTGAIMGVPAHDDRDFEFGKKFGLEIKCVVKPDRVSVISVHPKGTKFDITAEIDKKLNRILGGEEVSIAPGILISSDKFDGHDSEDAKWEITKFVGGERKVQYRLRDWLISRQRYWGPPIPMIYCDTCGWQPVPEKDLPVKLPFVKDFRPTGTDQSPLASVEKFYKVRCPKCKGWARRETDVSDTFLDSAWYFLRYPSVKNKKAAWDPTVTKHWLPVDMYIGGAEHSVLHLLYSRFLSMVFHDLGLTHFDEPFTRFRAHGLLIKDSAKMSKSKGNVVNPDQYIKAYGADAFRMYLMFLGPFDQGGDFRDLGIKGITRFLERVWRFWESNKQPRVRRDFSMNMSSGTPLTSSEMDSKHIIRSVHRAIKKVTEDIETLQYNTAISSLMVLLNEFEARPYAVSAADVKIFLKLLAPFAPHLTEELWQEDFAKKGKFVSVHHEPWPAFDPTLIQEDAFELVIQINGKVRGKIRVPIGITELEATARAQNEPGVRAHLSRDPKKVIFVPKRLINFVV